MTPARRSRHGGAGTAEHRRRAAARHVRGTPARAWRATLAGVRIQGRDQVAALVLVLGLIAAAAVGLVVHGGQRVTAEPPTPPVPGVATPASPETSSTGAGGTTAHGASFHCSSHRASTGGADPVALCIPSLRVDTSVLSLGLNTDRTVQVPPLSEVGEAGWYRYSAPPGTIGPTVILGHVDSAQYGEGVFFQLGRLRPGAQVELWRGDGKVATYRVDKLAQVAKSNFPTDAVYGATSGPAIRLVTCGGQFDSSTGNYLDNIIAYGTLLDLRSA